MADDYDEPSLSQAAPRNSHAGTQSNQYDSQESEMPPVANQEYADLLAQTQEKAAK